MTELLIALLGLVATAIWVVSVLIVFRRMDRRIRRLESMFHTPELGDREMARVDERLGLGVPR